MSEQIISTEKAYVFDAETNEIKINVAPQGKRPLVTVHELAKPTLEQLVTREQQSTYETEEVAKDEDVIRANDDKANANLYHAIVRKVQGYDFEDGVSPDSLRDITEEQAKALPSPHKSAAIRGLYVTSAELVYDEEATSFRVSLDQEIEVKQSIGLGDPAEFELSWKLKEPTDAQRAKYRDNAMQVRNVRGARRARSRVVSNLRAAVEAFDALVISCAGGRLADGTVLARDLDEVSRRRFIAAIDPVFKRAVVSAAMNAQEASLQD